MTVAFGDHDPEDAWDASDPWPVRREILGRWVASVADEYLTGGASLRVVARVRDARARLQLAFGQPGLQPVEVAYLVALRFVLLELATALESS